MLEKAHVKMGASGEQIFFHAQKNGAPVWLPMYPEVRRALDLSAATARRRGRLSVFLLEGYAISSGRVRAQKRTTSRR
jgi:hypothetical protein